jgi:hypothetical protein
MKFFVENNHELCETMIHLELKSKGVWCGYLTDFPDIIRSFPEVLNGFGFKSFMFWLR